MSASRADHGRSRTDHLVLNTAARRRTATLAKGSGVLSVAFSPDAGESGGNVALFQASRHRRDLDRGLQIHRASAGRRHHTSDAFEPPDVLLV